MRHHVGTMYDVVIVGGGPAGLAAALTLGRGRKSVLLCDSGPRRNAAAVHIHNFVTRDGTPPAEFRQIARQQLERYPRVVVRDAPIQSIRGERGNFAVRLVDATVAARRILLCTGMIDELPDIDGFRALWGKSLFQCPYCHGWEIQDQRFGYLAANQDSLVFALFLRGWTDEVVAVTGGKFEVPAEMRSRLASGGVDLEERRIARLVPREDRLDRVEFTEGAPLSLDAMFVHPPQRQVDAVRDLGVALDSAGHVQVDEMTRETSIPGVYAAGDLTTPVQGALLAAAAGMRAAATLNHALTIELATTGALQESP